MGPARIYLYLPGTAVYHTSTAVPVEQVAVSVSTQGITAVDTGSTT